MPTRLPLVASLACCLGISLNAQEQTAANLLDSTTLDHALSSVRWGMYGEGHYNNYQQNDKTNKMDFHRLVLLAEAQLAPNWRFVGEIEFEHALIGEGKPGEIEVEQALLDWQFHENHSVKGGMMLVPISMGNLYHEPNVFHGVERPLFDSRIVPTTWFDVGLGAAGKIIDQLTYEVAIQTGIDGQSLSAGNGFRSGRQKGAEAKSQDLMGTVRVDYRPLPSTWLALSFNYGGIDQRTTDQGAVDSDNVTGSLLVIEGRWADHGFDTGISFGQGSISDPEELPSANLPETFRGISAFVAYDVLRLAELESPQQLFVFFRYEKIDNHASVPASVTQDDSLNTRAFQYGLTWKPNAHVVGKFDYQDIENDDGSGADVWSLGGGFAF